MANVAILGYGVVGSGVAEVIRRNAQAIKSRSGADINLLKILDIRDFPESPDRGLFTKNADEIFENEKIDIVVETIGGTGAAYEFVKRALKKGKHVVTSNKELVSSFGPQLLEMAEKMHVNFLFEACVGGGIPIIRPLNQCLAANEIAGISGILNGTTNYILTRMRREGTDFNVALKDAQLKGYAEADPTNDIDGYDTARKIAILSSIAYNEFVDAKKIHIEGIRGISHEDMQYADKMDCVIKLIGLSKKVEDKILAMVSPFLVSKSNPLASVEDEFNAIMVKGNAVDELMFYGKGAGKMPTASAVTADIIEIARNEKRSGKKVWHVGDNDILLKPDDVELKFFVRLEVSDKLEAMNLASRIIGNISEVSLGDSEVKNEIAFITPVKKEKQFKVEIEKLAKNKAVKSVISKIRFLNGSLNLNGQ